VVLTSEGGTLTGRFFTPFPAPTVNLTTEGLVDWAHWGNGGPTVFDHKNNVAQQISNYTLVGTSAIFSLSDNPTGFTWTDGTPTASATNVHTGIFAIGVGNGFQFTVPADTNLKTVRVNLGLWRAGGMFEATLSDGSAPAYVDGSLVNEMGTSNAVYTLNFAAASAGQTLTIKYTAQAQFHTSGNVTLESASLINGSDPDEYPIITVSSPADGATFSATDQVSIYANAFDPDGSIANVEFYVDGFLLGNGVAAGSNQYSIPWTTLYPGAHTVTAIAIDNEGARTTSAPVDVTALQGSGGVLQASVYSPPFAYFVNLTSEGALDWGHWGLNGPANYDHKNGVTQLINMTRIGASPTNWFVNSLTNSTWSGGTPTASGNTQSGIITGETGTGGSGYEITVPADTNLKTLKLHVGTWVGVGRFEAAISDGSAPTYVDTSLSSCAGGTFDGIYTVQYKAASANQKLRVRYTLLTDCDGSGGFGNVTLKSATLTNTGAINSLPSVTITSPSNGTVVSAGASVQINANASDSDNGIAKVEFFQGSTKLGEDLDFPYQFTWNNVPGGLLTLYAVATDGLGATTTSAPVNIQGNAAPVVNSGYNQSIILPASTTLFGSATDDGLPTSPGSLTYSWTKTSGPGTVSFGTPTSAVTTASFSSEGDYVLRLTANDGNRTSFGEVTVGAHTAVTINLTPTADAHVRDGTSANTNFGSATTIEVQSSGTTGENRDAYFKFDLSSVGDVNNAKLRFFAATSAAGSVSTSIYPVSNTSWTEATINWNNRPALATPVLSSVTVSGTTFQFYELDVTNYLIGEKNAGRNIVTLALHSQSNSTVFVKVNSKEAASNKPQLVVSTSEATFVQDKTPGTLRNNLSAFVGMKFTVGTAPVTVTSLGRIYVNGNTGTHTVKIVNAGTGADVAGASVSINMSTGTPSNGFKYAALAAPVILAANIAYYLVSQETSGGDQWYDSNTVLTTTTIAAVNNAVSKPNNSWVAAGGANNSFGPVDFKYASSTPLLTQTYHLHGNASATSGLLKLDTEGPDDPITPVLSINLKGQPNGEYIISGFDTQSPIIGKDGFIPAGAPAVFNLWMKNSGTAGTIFPRVKLHLNSAAGPQLCTTTGATALTQTTTKYTLSCVTSTGITTAATDRYYLWVGVNMTAGSSNKNFNGELDVEGTPNGNYDSQILVPAPLAPTIYQLSPALGPTGTVVTITGANFGPLQSAGTVTFNGALASVSSWSSNSIVATVPASAITGPVVVTANGAASVGVTYTVGPVDSDADGLPDLWELQYFGNLLQGPNDDPDGDGATNLQEFNQGRNPSKGTVIDIDGLVNLKLYSPLDP
jgi:Bacterial Ig domain/IPT/TIG domain